MFHAKTLIFTSLLAATVAHSADFAGVAWDYDRGDAVSPHWRLTLVQAAQGTSQQRQLSLTPTDEATCQQWQGSAWTPDTWCAPVPCPGPGAYQVLLQADDSAPTNLASFGIGPGPGCPLVPLEQAPHPTPAPVRVPPKTAPKPSPPTPAPVTTARPGERPSPGGLTPDVEAPGPPTEHGTAPQILAAFADLEAQYLALLQQIEQQYEAVRNDARYTADQQHAVYQQARAQQRAIVQHARQAWAAFYREYSQQIRQVQRWHAAHQQRVDAPETRR